MEGRGSLTVVATPIGNLSDLSPRAVEVLSNSDAWAVEDTRVSGKLQSHLGIKKPMWVLNDHTSSNAVEQYVQRISGGMNVAILSDGGTPVISDPGTELIDLCAKAGVEIDSCPGPSAVANALSLSGFYAQRYVFLGFLGKKPGDIAKELRPFAESPMTLVLFESPHRIERALQTCFEVLGSRRFAICREMTKLHQQVQRGVLELPVNLPGFTFKGEITLVIEGRRRNSGTDI